MKTITQNLLHFVKKQAMSLTVLITLVGFQSQATNFNTNSSSKFTFQTNRVWINATSTQGAFSQILMGYRTGATDGYDQGLDGAFFNDGAIQLASLIGDTRYAIQFKGLPFTVSDVVSLSFKATYSGTYTFAIDHFDGFFNDPNFAVYILDTENNTYNNLKTGSYTFTSNAGTYNNRFKITYVQTLNTPTLGTNQNTFTSSDLSVFQSNNSLVVNGGSTMLKNISIYAINGQLLYQNNQLNASLTTITTGSINQQPIIIKVTTQEGITVSKKWLYL